MYRPGEEEYEADLEETELENKQETKNKEETKKHKIMTRENVKNFTKQQIKDTIIVGGITLGVFMLNPWFEIGGIATTAICAFVAKKTLNLACRKIFGKKHNIKKREKAAKFSDYVKMTISAAALVTPILLGGNPITIAAGIGGAVVLTKKVIELLIKDKKLNKEIDKENREARRAERQSRRLAANNNHTINENAAANEDADEDEDQYEQGRTR